MRGWAITTQCVSSLCLPRATQQSAVLCWVAVTPGLTAVTHTHTHRAKISDSQTLAVSCGQGEGFKSSEHSTWTCWTCPLCLLLAIVLPSTFSNFYRFSKIFVVVQRHLDPIKRYTLQTCTQQAAASTPHVKIHAQACSWERHKPSLIIMGGVTQ